MRAKASSCDCRCREGEYPCPCMKESDAVALERIAQKSGQVPPPFQVLAQRAGAVSSFVAYRDQVFESGPLTARDRSLVQLTAAAALRLSFCIDKLVKAAKEAGVTQAEIVQASLIASIQSANSMLHAVHEGISRE